VSETADALRAIWEQRRENVLERVGVVEEAIAEGLSGRLDADLQARAAREAHMLAGSAGTFGFLDASAAARELEHALEGPEAPPEDTFPHLADLVGRLRADLENEPGAALTAESPGPEPAERDEMLIAGEERLTEALAAEIRARGVSARTIPMLAEVGAAIGAGADMLVLDLGTPEGVGEALDCLAASAHELPVVVLVAEDLLVDRVEIARRGGRAFLPRDAPVVDLADATLSLLHRVRPQNATIVTVDDDPAILDAVGAVLGAAGYRIERCDSPALFWDLVERVTPDLVVTDIDMPQVSGLELCAALRAEARFESLPVMVLTARTDPETVIDVFAAGADDFVSKPLIGPELLARVNGRLERVRLFRALAETDPLTGLANRRRSYEVLSEALSTADRLGQPVSLAVIDLDGFKSLNDAHGHAAGDAALRAVAASLNRSFTGSESVARWGGDEFVIGIPGLPSADARERLGAFVEDLRATETGLGDQRIRASAGVAEYPRDAQDLHGLYQAADEALYGAKQAGGDRVHDAGTTLQGDAERVDVVLVEDDPVLCELVEHALHTRGYSTRRIMDGLEASVDLAAATPDVVAPVVLLDWDLPSVDGLRILTTMAENGTLRRTRVIMLTGRASEAEVLRALEAGASDHVAKPFSVPVLMQRIRQALSDQR
jgi:diguanylate cyclase (GGDEF)-like protein